MEVLLANRINSITLSHIEDSSVTLLKKMF